MSASAQPSTPPTSRRVVIVANASDYVGPALARALARGGCDLVLGDPLPELAAELADLGAESWVADGVRDLADPSAAIRLLDLAMDAYGRVDAAAFFTGTIVTGPFLDSEPDDLARVVSGNIEAAYRALRVFLPPMVAAGSGQVLAITSATGLRVTPSAPLYSATRAGANMLVRNVAREVAGHGVQVNAVGTNFMDFPGFVAASGADDPEIRARIERGVPLGRLGTMDEFARFCSVFLDGTSGFQTGQVIGYDGGWSA